MGPTPYSDGRSSLYELSFIFWMTYVKGGVESKRHYGWFISKTSYTYRAKPFEGIIGSKGVGLNGALNSSHNGWKINSLLDRLIDCPALTFL